MPTLLFSIFYIFGSFADLASTRMAIDSGAGQEANPLSPGGFYGMLIAEAIIAIVAIALFGYSYSKIFRDRQKPWAPEIIKYHVLLFLPVNFLAIKYIGAASNLLVLSTGAGLLELEARFLRPIPENVVFWIFVISNGLVTLAIMELALCLAGIHRREHAAAPD